MTTTRISKMKGKTLEELYGLKKSKEIKEKMSQSRKKLFAQGFINPMLGKIITKCITCHIKSNKNRESWTEYYHDLLFKKYGYNYIELDKLNTNLHN